MLVSLEWLNEYVDTKDLTPEQIAHELTMSGLEVEGIEHIGAKFTDIVVAQIKDIKPHPDAEKLRLVTVFNGKETKEVVCGAQNIEVGQIIPFASIGSKVLDRKSGEQFELKPVKIRGVASEGMLCSADELGVDELGLQEEDGILILNKIYSDVKAGQDVKEVLNIKDDIVIHVAPTANRGDQMSIVGIAREVATLFNKPLNFSHIECTNKLNDIDFKVEIKDEDTCKYYAAGILKDIKLGKSPDWMQRRLLASGVRSINNIVDITNYVMLEYGQPLHAFDMDKLNNYLCVRRAKQGEKMVTLDEVERELKTDSVLIANENEAVAMAGLMGGYNSEVDNNTKNIALESAYFVPSTTRKSARSVGHRTEASARFERGVDIGAVKPALMRSIQLMIELADAKFEGLTEAGNDELPAIEITLRFAQIKRILGTEIPASKCIQILESLGFELLGKNNSAAKMLVPSYRRNDVTREIDLIEEISRIYGYDNIPATLPNKTQAAEISDETKLLKSINQLFLGKGFNEVMTTSLTGIPTLKLVGMSYDDEKAVKVTNPQSEEHTMLRQNLIPNIINVVKHNNAQGEKNVWIYEIGKTYFVTGQADAKNTGVEEKRVLAGALTGEVNSSLWGQNKQSDFYSIKGVVESLFKLLNIDNRIFFQPLEDVEYLHPGRSAEVFLQHKQPVSLGKFGQLHPDTQKKAKINQPVFIFEIDLEAIIANTPKSTSKFKELPQYPSVTRDMAFIVPQSISNQEIEKAIKKASTKLFKNVNIFDVYQGEHVEQGHKSVAYRITLQDVKSTLTDELVDAEISKIKDGLKKAYAEISFRE